MQHVHEMDIECQCVKYKKKRMQLRKKCAEIFSEMIGTKSNPPTWLEEDGAVLGYDHIISCMNSNQKVVKVNWKLSEKFSAERGRRVEVDGVGARGG